MQPLRRNSFHIIDKADDERADIDEQLADTGNAESDFKILAVTACPTGIAHTYMAAEGIGESSKSCTTVP